jgi:hypothetical protein
LYYPELLINHIISKNSFQMKQPSTDFQNTMPFQSRKILLVPLLFLLHYYLAYAQPQTFFHKAWTETDASISPGFINHVASVTNSGGYVYVAGSTLNSSSTYSLNLSKYSHSGTLQWSVQYTANTGGNVYVGAIALDASENVIITGSAYNGSSNNYDLLVIKYNSSGTAQWHYLLDGGYSSNEGGAGVVCDGSSNVFVTGVVWSSAINPDAVTICLNSSGTVQWKSSFDNVSLVDAGTSIVLSSGAAIVTGITQTNTSTWEYLTARYSQSTGSLLGSNVTSLSGTTIEHAMAVTLDNSGNIYITGAMGGSGTGLDVKTIKLNSSLAIQWTATWNGSANHDDVGQGIAVDASGNVYVGGYTTGTNRDALLLKYSSSGSLSSALTYDAEGGDDEYVGLALTSGGDVFAGGYVTRKGNKDFFSAFYSSGSLIWSEAYNGIYNKDDAIQQVTPDGSGNFIVAGMSGQSDGSRHVLIIEYAQMTLVKPQNENVSAPFIENRGQLLDTGGDAVNDIRYYSNKTYPNVYLFDKSVSYVFARIDTIPATNDTLARIDLNFPAGRTIIATGLEEQDGFNNYYLGHIPEGRERVPLENKVLFPDLYPNIDALFGQGQDGLFIRFIYKPGSTVSDLKMEFTGNTAMSILTNGDLKVESALESLILPKPTAMTIGSEGTETAITGWSAAYSIGTDGKVSITTGSYDGSKTLVVKVGRERPPTGDNCDYWSTYYGDTQDDVALGSDVDNEGNMYFTGETRSAHFPTTSGLIQMINGTIDAFVTCFKQPDRIKWGTFYGGTDNNSNVSPIDVGSAVKFNQSNNMVYFVGRTSSSDFPTYQTTGYFNNTTTSGFHARGFIVKLKGDDGTHNWATLFGDPNCELDGVTALTVLRNGNIVVGGFSFYLLSGFSFDFPTFTDGVSHTQEYGHAYVAEFSNDNAQLWATRLVNTNALSDGTIDTYLTDITEDRATNDLLVAGDALTVGDGYIPYGSNTYSFHGYGNKDVFIIRFAEDRTLTWSTYFGGTNNDRVNSILALNNGDFAITGSTSSTESQSFPVQAYGSTTSEFVNDLTYNGGTGDVFIAKFASDNKLKWCRYLGGPGSDSQGFIFIGDNLNYDGGGNGATTDGTSIYLTGAVQNEYGPLQGGTMCKTFYDTINRGHDLAGYDAFLAIIDENNFLRYNSYWGGSNNALVISDFGFTISTGTNPLLGATQIVAMDANVVVYL